MTSLDCGDRPQDTAGGIHATPDNPYGRDIGNVLSITVGDSGCAPVLGSEWSTKSDYSGSTKCGWFDRMFDCVKDHYTSDVDADIHDGCCIDGLPTLEKQRGFYQGYGPDPNPSPNGRYYRMQLTTCSPDTANPLLKYKSGKCEDTFNRFCTTDNMLSAPACVSWSNANNDNGIINNEIVADKIRGYCSTRITSPECAKFKDYENKKFYQQMMTNYCNASAANFGSPICRQWCVENPEVGGGDGMCDAGATMFCKENPGDDICKCELSPVQFITTQDNRNINPACVDAACKQAGVYVPNRFNDPCPPIVDCSVKIAIENAGANVDVSGNTFEQNCSSSGTTNVSNEVTNTTTDTTMDTVDQTETAQPILSAESSSLSTNEIAGIVIGAFLLLILVIFIGFMIYRYKKKRNDTYDPGMDAQYYPDAYNPSGLSSYEKFPSSAAESEYGDLRLFELDTTGDDSHYTPLPRAEQDMQQDMQIDDQYSSTNDPFSSDNLSSNRYANVPVIDK